MQKRTIDRVLFVTLVRTAEEKARLRLLLESLRAFGGELSASPLWLFEARPQRVSCQDLAAPDVRILPLEVSEAVRSYYFADKVCACAQAETQAPAHVRSLIWVDTTCLFVQPPLLFDLGPSYDAAVRPVHIKNVGLLPTEPLDDFWAGVCETVGLSDIQTTVETFVGAQYIRAYFNSHAFAVDPAKGLLTQWRAHFEDLVNDEAYQETACQDQLHQVFLHQAILSALLIAALDADRIHRLPPSYNYPYNLHASLPADRKAAALNDLISLTYEGRTLDPDAVDDIEIREPLRSWLAAHIGE
jgi:hypothetical protein